MAEPVASRRSKSADNQELWKSTEWRMLHMKASSRFSRLGPPAAEASLLPRARVQLPSPSMALCKGWAAGAPPFRPSLASAGLRPRRSVPLGAQPCTAASPNPHALQVAPCHKRYAHDWSTCPYSHPRDAARRRDPRVHPHTGVACPAMKQVCRHALGQRACQMRAAARQAASRATCGAALTGQHAPVGLLAGWLGQLHGQLHLQKYPVPVQHSEAGCPCGPALHPHV